MTTYTPILEWTAQGPNVVALNYLFAQLEKDEGKYPEIAPIVVFIAFSIESYLNSLGSEFIPIWDELERLPWKTKMLILHDKAGQDLDWGKLPLQFASEVFTLRDKLAHGKPEAMKGQAFTEKGSAEAYAALMGMDEKLREKYTPQWYLKLNREWAATSREKYRNLMRYMANLFRLQENDYLRIATGKIVKSE